MSAIHLNKEAVLQKIDNYELNGSNWKFEEFLK